MPLSNTEIKILLKQARGYMVESSIFSLNEALKIYDRIIDSAPEPFYYAERSILKYRLHRPAGSMLDGAIEDINKAIELDPDRGDYYRIRADYRYYRISAGNPPYNSQILKRLIDDYRLCISKAPTAVPAWLSLISVYIIGEDFDEAISLYGQCAYYTDTGMDRLGRSLLGCIALILAGDPVGDEDLADLKKNGAELNFIAPYITGIISFINHLSESNKPKRDEIIRVIQLYIQHFSTAGLKNNLMTKFNLREGSRKEALEKAQKELAGFVAKQEQKKRDSEKKKKYAWIWVLAIMLVIFIISAFNRDDSDSHSHYNGAIPSYSLPSFEIPTFDIPDYEPLPTISFPSRPIPTLDISDWEFE